MKLIDSLRVQLVALMTTHPVIAYKVFSSVRATQENGDEPYLHLKSLSERELSVLGALGFIDGSMGYEKLLEPIIFEAIVELVRGVNTDMEIV